MVEKCDSRVVETFKGISLVHGHDIHREVCSVKLIITKNKSNVIARNCSIYLSKFNNGATAAAAEERNKMRPADDDSQRLTLENELFQLFEWLEWLKWLKLLPWQQRNLCDLSFDKIMIVSILKNQLNKECKRQRLDFSLYVLRYLNICETEEIIQKIMKLFLSLTLQALIKESFVPRVIKAIRNFCMESLNNQSFVAKAPKLNKETEMINHSLQYEDRNYNKKITANLKNIQCYYKRLTLLLFNSLTKQALSQERLVLTVIKANSNVCLKSLLNQSFIKKALRFYKEIECWKKCFVVNFWKASLQAEKQSSKNKKKLKANSEYG